MPKTAKLDLSPVRELNRITGELVLMTRDAKELTLRLEEVRRKVDEIHEALAEMLAEMRPD